MADEFDELEGLNEEVNLANRGEGLTKQTLNVIFLLDCSYSMEGSRLGQLNNAMPGVLDTMKEIGEDEGVNVSLRVISFSDRPKWEYGSVEQGEDVNNIVWNDLHPIGGTDTASAIYEACKSLKKSYLGARALHPVVILITDGGSNEPDKTLAAIEELKKKLAGNTGKEKVTRIAIGVEDYYEPELNAFASVGKIVHADGVENENVPLVFKIDKAEDLKKYINCVAASSMYSSITGAADTEGTTVELDDDVNAPADDDWVD